LIRSSGLGSLVRHRGEPFWPATTVRRVPTSGRCPWPRLSSASPPDVAATAESRSGQCRRGTHLVPRRPAEPHLRPDVASSPGRCVVWPTRRNLPPATASRPRSSRSPRRPSERESATRCPRLPARVDSVRPPHPQRGRMRQACASARRPPLASATSGRRLVSGNATPCPASRSRSSRIARTGGLARRGVVRPGVRKRDHLVSSPLHFCDRLRGRRRAAPPETGPPSAWHIPALACRLQDQRLELAPAGTCAHRSRSGPSRAVCSASITCSILAHRSADRPPGPAASPGRGDRPDQHGDFGHCGDLGRPRRSCIALTAEVPRSLAASSRPARSSTAGPRSPRVPTPRGQRRTCVTMRSRNLAELQHPAEPPARQEQRHPATDIQSLGGRTGLASGRCSVPPRHCPTTRHNRGCAGRSNADRLAPPPRAGLRSRPRRLARRPPP